MTSSSTRDVRRLRLLLLLLLLTVLPVAQSAQVEAAHADPEVIAHRGASRVAPENTLRAIRSAVRAGADLVEVDVRVTADRRLVLLHDAGLGRTTDVEQRFPDREPWHVGDFTLAEIRTLDAGAWKDRRFAGEKVPTLAQALRAVEGRAGLLVELKDPVREVGMEALVAQELTRDGTATGRPARGQRVMVQSFDYLAVARFAALQPDIPVGVVTDGPPSAAQLDIYQRFADRVAPPHRTVDRSLIRSARSRGLSITPYTVNDPRAMRRLLGLGVDGIVSDVPGRLRQVRATGR